jgi:hypothetical protein
MVDSHNRFPVWQVNQMPYGRSGQTYFQSSERLTITASVPGATVQLPFRYCQLSHFSGRKTEMPCQGYNRPYTTRLLFVPMYTLPFTTTRFAKWGSGEGSLPLV